MIGLISNTISSINFWIKNIDIVFNIHVRHGVTDVAKACKNFGFFTSKIFNNKTHLFHLSGFKLTPGHLRIWTK